MSLIRKFTIHLIVLLGLLTASGQSFAQESVPDPVKWAKILDSKDYHVDDTVFYLARLLEKVDSTQTFKFFEDLAEAGKTRGDYFRVRYNRLKAGEIFFENVYFTFYQDRRARDIEPYKRQIMDLYTAALDIAYRLEDDYLIAFTSYYYSSVIVLMDEVGIAVMYAKNGIDLFEKLSYNVKPEYYQFLAELLYKVREYDQCINYGKKAVLGWQKPPYKPNGLVISGTNTVALGYHRQQKYDSAFIFYDRALQLAREMNDTVWIGIVSGNMGQIYYAQGKYDTAYALLKMDYQSSKAKRYYDNAGNSLQWAARANLARGNKMEALTELREARQLLKLWPDANYLRNTYYTATQIFREMSAYDSAFYYNSLYGAINDSLEKVVATSSLSLSRAKLNDETSKYNIQTLKREKKEQLLLRNVIIGGIILVSIFALLMLNRKRLQTRLKMERVEQEKFLMEQEKVLMEQEIASAKDQLSMFTENIIEKTNLIEKLQSQQIGREASAEQLDMITELSQQTILTEDDWLKFKNLFSKIYPSFFTVLKEKFPDITLAEQRMAALIRLNLTTRQIASMLGISVDSVHKSRQRLRHRFQVGADINLDEMVANL